VVERLWLKNTVVERHSKKRWVCNCWTVHIYPWKQNKHEFLSLIFVPYISSFCKFSPHCCVIYLLLFALSFDMFLLWDPHTPTFLESEVTIYCLRSTKTRRGEIAFVCVALFVLERLHWSFQKLFIIIQSYPSSSLIYFLWSTDTCRVWHRPL
jgi:hypothetical protein